MTFGALIGKGLLWCVSTALRLAWGLLPTNRPLIWAMIPHANGSYPSFFLHALDRQTGMTRI